MTFYKQTRKTKIPDELIYEMDNGNPIYYRGYKQVLSGKKTFEQIMGSSVNQSKFISTIVKFLFQFEKDNYEILFNELGLQLAKNAIRAADIAIIDKNVLKNIKDKNKYLNIAPKIIIEIDSRADVTEIGGSYFIKKTQDLLDFGVEKVIWIFTESKKIKVAEKGKDWLIFDWDKSFKILNDVDFCLKDLIEK